MVYLIDDTKYSLSYQELREKYYHFLGLSDMKFVEEAAEALHLACIICFLKEIPTYVCLSDKGIIHELVHIIHLKENFTPIADIRKLFEVTLKLD